MKILPGSQQPSLAAEATEDKSEKVAAPAKGRVAAKPARAKDQVDFSTSLSAGLQAQQDQQARRVESINERIKAGTYQVSSHAVAEKMLSGGSEF